MRKGEVGQEESLKLGYTDAILVAAKGSTQKGRVAAVIANASRARMSLSHGSKPMRSRNSAAFFCSGVWYVLSFVRGKRSCNRCSFVTISQSDIISGRGELRVTTIL